MKLWSDPDVRWLTGMHDAEGKSYLVREPYEELLWWLKLPALLDVGREAAPKREAAQKIAADVAKALDRAATAGYRVDVLSAVQAEPGAPAEPGAKDGLKAARLNTALGPVLPAGETVDAPERPEPAEAPREAAKPIRKKIED